MDLSADAPDVAAEERDPASLLNKVKELIKLRVSEPALVAYAEFVPVFALKDKYPLAYIRANGKERLLIVLNPAAEDAEAAFNLNYRIKRGDVVSGGGTMSVRGKTVTVRMKGVSYAIFRANESK